MNIKQKVLILNPLSVKEEESILYYLVWYGGTVWFETLLRNKNIKGRSKYVDTFRGGYGRIGRTTIDKMQTVRELLGLYPLNEWVNDYAGNFSMSFINRTIEHSQFRIKYVVEVEIS